MNLLLKRILYIVPSLFVVGVAVVLLAYFYVATDLPSVAKLKEIHLQTPLRIYTADRELMGEFGEKRRIPIEYSEIPPTLIQAFLAIEDDRFFEHPGIDYEGLLRAAIILFRTGEKKQGGSTITMQLARNYFLTSTRTYKRKLKEIFLALLIERQFNKQEILNLYLNKIFLGHHAYGVGAAVQVYYGKSVGDLNLAQMAMIAGLPKGPSRYNPLSYPTAAITRRNAVLKRMLELEMITLEQFESAVSSPVTATWHRAPLDVSAPYVAEMVRAEMVERYGDDAYTGGYTVITTLNGQYQRYADESLRKSLRAYDLRHGWRGSEAIFDLKEQSPEIILANYFPIGELQPAVITAVLASSAQAVLADSRAIVLDEKQYTWARAYINENQRGLPPETASDVLTAGQVVRLIKQSQGWTLRQVPDVAGAIVALQPNNGAVLALSGGYDFQLSKFNRAVQSKRQPGSSFKPFIYSAALTRGYTPASIITDTPVVFSNQGTRQDWRPSNYSGKFFGPTRLREALKHSRNLISVRLVDEMGLRTVIDHVLQFGFERTSLPHNLTFALGSGAASPIEMATGYATFANGGFKVNAYLVDEIYLNDTLIYQESLLTACIECLLPTSTPTATFASAGTVANRVSDGSPSLPYPAPSIISSGVAYQITSMMQDVIRSGTGRRAGSLGRNDLAGKTGTTDDQRDTWFSGFNRDIVCTVWVGFDDVRPLGRHETGSRAALPMWIDFMGRVLKDKPETNFYKPDDIISARINIVNGLLAHPADESAIIETFRKDYLPKGIADAPGAKGIPGGDLDQMLF